MSTLTSHDLRVSIPIGTTDVDRTSQRVTFSGGSIFDRKTMHLQLAPWNREAWFEIEVYRQTWWQRLLGIEGEWVIVITITGDLTTQAFHRTR